MKEQFYVMLRTSNDSPGCALSVGVVSSVERKLKMKG